MKRNQVAGGFVLLEVLVALVVFSLGLLGMLGFQASAMAIATDSRFRTEAAMLADELIGKMNASSMSTVRTDFASSGTKYLDWYNNRVKGNAKLPNATASVTFSNTVTPDTWIATVQIEWDMPGSSGESTDLRHAKYVTQAMLF